MKVAFEATPLLGPRTGVGEFCFAVLQAMFSLDEVEINPFAITWRNRKNLVFELGNVPEGWQLPMPARPLHMIWSKINFPPIELFLGRTDIVHGSNFVVPPSLSAKRVVTVHDLTPLLYPEAADPSTLVFPRLIQRAINTGAFVHTPSEFIANQVREHFDVDDAKVVSIYHGIPTGSVSIDVSGETDIAYQKIVPNGRFILGLGTIEPRKDFVTLVKAFSDIAFEFDDLQLVIAGKRGWGAEQLDIEVAKTGLGNRIIRPGYIDELTRRSLLANAIAFAYPSLYEGFGLPPLQAMQLATPVIATRAGSLPEVLADAAMMVDVGDRQAIASALRDLLDNEMIRQDYITRGLARAEQFSWQKCAKGLVSLYRAALNS